MHRNVSAQQFLILVLTLSVLGVVGLPLDRTEAKPTDSEVTEQESTKPATVGEARTRARLLYETIRGSLQVMHRDFFDDENPPAIPSQSLEEVFDELAESYDVRVRWLNVHTDIVNVDHQPRDEFEKRAAKALASGEVAFEEHDDRSYHYAGAIRLASQCLKCHVKTRTSTEDRTAGLVISMPLRQPQ